MKLLSIFVALLTLLCGLEAADVKINPGKPMNKDAGKVYSLKQQLIIFDDGEAFFFKTPHNIKVAENGSIFVQDKKQLLQFDEKGKFIKNYFNEGQGPKEVTGITNYLLVGEKLIVHDSGQNKILIFNHHTGKYLYEYKLYTAAIDRLHFSVGDRLYFRRYQPMDTKGKLEIVDMPVHLICISEGGKKVEGKFQFSIKHMVLRNGDNCFSGGRVSFLACPVGDGTIFISHTEDYLIKVYDANKNEVPRSFTRKYQRVKVTADTRKYAPGGNFGKIGIGDGRFHTVPVPEFHPDIQHLFYGKGKLWVFTSTVQNENQLLVDVYSNNGDYVNNFYIVCPDKDRAYDVGSWLRFLKDESVYATEQDEDGMYTIRKYKWCILD